MEEINNYCFNNKEFRQLEKLADEIYNTCVVLEYFCVNQREIEELYNISPIVKTLRQNADILNSIFINFVKDEL